MSSISCHYQQSFEVNAYFPHEKHSVLIHKKSKGRGLLRFKLLKGSRVVSPFDFFLSHSHTVGCLNKYSIDSNSDFKSNSLLRNQTLA